jgi:hypothetical protein
MLITQSHTTFTLNRYLSLHNIPFCYLSTYVIIQTKLLAIVPRSLQWAMGICESDRHRCHFVTTCRSTTSQV